jgi:hypothetical protein
MRFICLLFLSIIILATGAGAQTFYSGSEYGIFLGGAQYFGDLNNQYGFKYVRPAGGAFVRLHLNPYIALRGSVSYTKIGYDDKFNNNPYQQKRNLSFRNDIVELAIQTELNFVRFETGNPEHRFTPYLTGGIGVLYHSPYVIYQDQKYFLRPLGTEGQNTETYSNRKYSHFAACVPVGAGFKYWIRPGFNLGFEVADRITFTDYLDDVSTTYVGDNLFSNDPQLANAAFNLQDRSGEQGGEKLGRAGKQRGNNHTVDQYMYFIFKLSFQFKVYKCPRYMNPIF